MAEHFVFPFGEPLVPVSQTDRRPKWLFVLGVYASAVHARWYGPDGRVRARALAVASEPYIFWRGDGAEEIVRRINVPSACGHLEVADAKLNGPSGTVLDEQFLRPLGAGREEAWLADLLPESRLNPSQTRALDREYGPLVERGLVPEATIPPVPRRFADAERIDALVEELHLSGADRLITLGDVPLREFVSRFDRRFARLAAFGQAEGEYGREHRIRIGGRLVELIPLVHPRQAGRLGSSSATWGRLHAHWVKRRLHERRLGET